MMYQPNRFPDIPPDLEDWPAPVSPGLDAAALAEEAATFGAPDKPAEEDVLIFNNHSLIVRILSIYPLALGIVGVVGSVEYGVSFLTLGSLFFLLVGYVMLTRVEELRIDFSQRTYELRTGSLWDPIVTGSLCDIRHLRLGSGRVSWRGGSYSYMNVELFWWSTQPNDVKGFQLKLENPMGSDSRTKTKRELETYAESLAARLQVPVIDDVGTWSIHQPGPQRRV